MPNAVKKLLVLFLIIFFNAIFKVVPIFISNSPFGGL